MPSEKVLKKKQQIVADLVEKIKAAVSCVIVDYKGISVSEDTSLRKELREAGVDYTVEKNTLLRRALEGTEYEAMSEHLTGATAIAFSSEDVIAPAKILQKMSDGKKKAGVFKVKTGFIDGRTVSASEIDALAKLPSKEELIAKMLAGFNAPISGFANVLSANLRGLAIVLNAIAEQKGA